MEIGRLGCLEEAVGWRNEVRVEDDAQTKEPGQGSDTNGVEAADERKLKGPFVCTAEEINEAFDHIKAVRYSQPIHLSGEYGMKPRSAGQSHRQLMPESHLQVSCRTSS